MILSLVCPFDRSNGEAARRYPNSLTVSEGKDLGGSLRFSY